MIPNYNNSELQTQDYEMTAEQIRLQEAREQYSLEKMGAISERAAVGHRAGRL